MYYLYITTMTSAKHNSIEDQLECTRVDLLLVGLTRQNETTVLETFREQTEPGAIPIHPLQVRATAI